MNEPERIAIVTDSTSDIPDSEKEALGIYIIPAVITIDGKSYNDGEGLNRNQFYQSLPGMKTAPSTASPPPLTFEKMYSNLFARGYDRVISIHVSERLSALYSMALQAARRFQDRVHVLDSGQVSLGLGFQVMEAAASAKAGTPIQQILDGLNTLHDRCRVIAMINKLDYLRRSGRVHWLTASISQWLNVKMILGLAEGIVERLAVVRTRRKALLELRKLVESWGPIERLGIMHSGIEKEARTLALSLAHLSPVPPLVINVTTVIGTHVGEGSLGVSALVR